MIQNCLLKMNERYLLASSYTVSKERRQFLKIEFFSQIYSAMIGK